MRKFICLLLAVAIARPALAAQSVTVDDLEQLLVSLKGKSDGSVAKKLSELELTERATSARLAGWQADFPARHVRSREALTALADASVFLDLPAADVPAAPPPDRATQVQILTRAVDTVTEALNRFPNFYATRITTRFEDTLPHREVWQQMQTVPGRGARSVASSGYGETAYQPLHSTAKVSVIVTYRDGGEVSDSEKAKKPRERAMGLTTVGEFGPILAVVLGDAVRSDVTWSHWEQGTTGPLAVFRFRVPLEKSHFLVELPNAGYLERLYPAYHGEIAVDPASGDVYRLTESADFAPPHDRIQTAVQVEYAQVAIGKRIYVLPVRGVALSRTPALSGYVPKQANVPTLQTHLNDVTFTQYHLFRADSRILPE